MRYIMVLLLQSRNISRRKVILQRALVIVALGLVIGGWLGLDPARQRYHLWKQERALKQAKEFIDNHDAADAQVALDVAFSAAPGRIDAWRMAADMLEQVGAQQSVRLRQHIVSMMDATLEDKLALVNGARKSTTSYRPRRTCHAYAGGGRPPQSLAAALSFTPYVTENSPIADALFDRLKKAYPDNDEFTVAQAMLRLRNPIRERADDARALLERLAANPKYSLRIRRELMTDSIARGDISTAKKWSALVVSEPEANFNDRLHKANFDLLVDRQPFDRVAGGLEALALSNPADAAELAHWLLAQGKERRPIAGSQPPRLDGRGRQGKGGAGGGGGTTEGLGQACLDD